MVTKTKKKTVKGKKRGRPAKKSVPKKTAKAAESKTVEKPKKSKRKNYKFSVGRRKSAVARVRLHNSGEPKLEVNGKKFEEYFPQPKLQKITTEPLEIAGQLGKLNFTIKVEGGGFRGQAEACRLGLARMMVQIDPELRKQLKQAGLLTRDPRVKERKKYGLKRARRAPQWRKR